MAPMWWIAAQTMYGPLSVQGSFMVSALINELVIYSLTLPRVYTERTLPFEASCNIENSSLVDKLILLRQRVPTTYGS